MVNVPSAAMTSMCAMPTRGSIPQRLLGEQEVDGLAGLVELVGRLGDLLVRAGPLDLARLGALRHHQTYQCNVALADACAERDASVRSGNEKRDHRLVAAIRTPLPS